MLLFYIRHGDPIYDPDSLSPLGHKQAERLVERLKDEGITEIHSSCLGRAIQTAEPTARLLGLDIGIEPWAAEVGADGYMSDFPDGQQTPISLIQNTYFRENGNQDLGYERAFESTGFSTSGMKQAAKIIEERSLPIKCCGIT